MKKIIVIFIICFMATTVYAEKSIVGEWKHKDGSTSVIEFKENQDLIWKYNVGVKNGYGEYKYERRVSTGVWEYAEGYVTINDKSTGEKINLIIYIGEYKYYFYYKFIGNNLIMTKREIGNGWMLENMVLVRVNPFG